MKPPVESGVYSVTLPLYLLWLILGLGSAASPGVAPTAFDGIQVHIASLGQAGDASYTGLRSDVLGLACHSDFNGVPGNEQQLCTGVPDGTIVLAPRALGDWQRARNVLVHETYHMVHRDALHEASAAAFACSAAWSAELCAAPTVFSQ